MYCYHLDAWAYSDTEHKYLVHEKKFTADEFKQMCSEVKCTGKWNDIDNLTEHLIKNHGFKKMKYLAYDIWGKEVDDWEW